MNEKTIELLCEKFGTTVEYLIPKAQVYGIWSDIMGLIACFIIIISTIYYWKHLREEYGEIGIENIEMLDFMLICMGLMVSAIALVVALVGIIPNLIMWITAPEIGLLELID